MNTIGSNTLEGNTVGSYNTAIGVTSGYSTTGSNNTFIGHNSGRSNTGNDNVFIGRSAGQNSGAVSDRLYIDNSSTSSPLIYGEFNNNFVKVNGTFQSTDTMTATTMGLADSSNRVATTKWVKQQGFSIGNTEYKIVNSDVTNNTTTLANVTGISFTAVANATYEIEFMGAFQSSVTTNGIAIALDIPDGSLIGINIASISPTAFRGTYQIADDAVTGSGSTAVGTANANVPLIGNWIYKAGGTGGTVQLRFKSEIASNSVTIKADLSVLKIKRIN